MADEKFHKKSALFDAFLKLDKVAGESHDSKHKDEIDILSFSWEVENKASHAYGGGGGAGKAQVGDLHIVKRLDKASTTLYKSVSLGDHISDGILTLRKAGGTPLEYLKIKFTDLSVTSINAFSDEESPVPLEEVSLNFSSYKITYTVQNKDGSGGPASDFGFNIKENKTV